MNEGMPKGKTNHDAYAGYRDLIETDLRKPTAIKQLRVALRTMARLINVTDEPVRAGRSMGVFLIMLCARWASRYGRRVEAIQGNKLLFNPALADTEAKEILEARHRAHNSTCVSFRQACVTNRS